jgi:hypothetical protein
MKKVIKVVFALIFSNAFSQDFNCSQDGYIDNSGGGFYTNIDGSGIDLTISGLVNDVCLSSQIYTGINNGQNTGEINLYQFTFSENVDVQFTIKDINQSPTGCYYDFLFFPDSPLITNAQNVTLIGDSVLPPTAGWSGEVTVTYYNISSFSITHGDGVSCNPGYVMLSKILINNFLSLDENALINNSQSNLLVDNNNVIIREEFEGNPKFEVYDFLGKKMNVNFECADDLIIDINNFPIGHYMIVYENSGIVRRERFTVIH